MSAHEHISASNLLDMQSALVEFRSVTRGGLRRRQSIKLESTRRAMRC